MGIGLLLFMAACSGHAGKTAPRKEKSFPDGYSIPSIQAALDERINYVLWNQPEEPERREPHTGPYVGQDIQVEVRVYPDGEGRRNVYAKTDIENWKDSVVTFKQYGGTIYAEDYRSPSGNPWLREDHEIAETFKMKVKPVRRPEFGSLPQKENMMKAAENGLQNICLDVTSNWSRGPWPGSKFYMLDFFEYEAMLTVWQVQAEGRAGLIPLALNWDSVSEEFQVQGSKGFAIELQSPDTDPSTRRWFDRQMEQVLKSYACTAAGLEPL